jgi:plastocyanin
MHKRPLARLVAWSGVVALSVILVGCAKHTSPTAPMGGGGIGSGMTGASFDSGSLAAPASFDHVFASAGTFKYHCTFHVSMGMVGTVVVAMGGADAATVTASGMTFSPASVTIRPGGTVHWTIADGTHTVTSG